MSDLPEKSPRKPRADAFRNRERILAVAREAFAEGGASVTLDDVVRRSGLGVGTLYRHFPTRDALVGALYLSEVERLAAAGRELSSSRPPVEALREWMLLFVDLLATKQVAREALDAMVGDLYATASEMLQGTFVRLAERAAASGEICLDVEALDLLRAVAGVATAGVGPKRGASARRMVDVLIAGVRVPKA